MNKVTLTTSYLQECLRQARYYEFCKDSDRALTAIKPIWANIDEPPDLEGLSLPEAWEVLLVCGGVVSAYGSTYQKKNYQELAADILTQAREMAIKIGERDLIAESEKQMATAYWRAGQVDNAITFLNTALDKYTEAEQLTNTICLLVQTNLIMLSLKAGQFDTAFNSYEKLKPFVDASDDLWMKTGFYNHAAAIFVSAGKFGYAIPLLERAVEYSKETKNDTFLGSNLNNLANAYIKLPKPDTKTAMRYAEQAGKLFLSINQLFPYALVLETKAIIYAQTGDYQKALLTIGESIKFLEKGENYSHYCESLWTRAEILIKMGEKKQSVDQFAELLQIAKDKLNLLTADNYTERFTKLLYLPVGRDFEEKERNFRAHLLDDALGRNGEIVTTTAHDIGMKHQTLSSILKKFPEILERHQVKLRFRSASPKKSVEIDKTENVFAIRTNTKRLEYLGIAKGQLIGVERRPLHQLDLSKPVAVQDVKHNHYCGFLVDAFGMYAFEDGRGNIERTFMPSEIFDAGQIIGIFNQQTRGFMPIENEGSFD